MPMLNNWLTTLPSDRLCCKKNKNVVNKLYRICYWQTFIRTIIIFCNGLPKQFIRKLPYFIGKLQCFIRKPPRFIAKPPLLGASSFQTHSAKSSFLALFLKAPHKKIPATPQQGFLFNSHQSAIRNPQSVYPHIPKSPHPQIFTSPNLHIPKFSNYLIFKFSNSTLSHYHISTLTH